MLAQVQDVVQRMGKVDIFVNSQCFNKKFSGTEFPEDI